MEFLAAWQWTIQSGIVLQLSKIQLYHSQRHSLLSFLHQSQKPDHPTLTDQMWNGIVYLTQNFEKFNKLSNDAFTKITVSIGTNEQVKNIPNQCMQIAYRF